MRSAIALLLAAGLSGAGCGGSDGGSTGDDTQVSDAAAPADAVTAQHGLLVTWMSNPALPGPVDNDITVTNAVFHIQHLQVIGDNGQPMTEAAFDITWNTPGADPETVAFVAAPSGLYSQINLEVDASLLDNSYVISGTTRVGPMMKPFRVEDRGSLDVDIKSYSVTLSPGADATMSVRLDLKDALNSVDWGMVNNQNGTLVLDDSSPQIIEFRDKLDDGFKKGS